MAIVSFLLSVAEPSGFWITIIKAFENVTNNYVLAIIFLTVIIKLIWTPIDMFNKRSQQKMSMVQAQMQPELDIINKKYAKDPNLLKQKQNEVYKKYNGKSMGGCFLMLVFMILNLTIFFSLFSGLNVMGSYKISESYDTLKYAYANCLNVANNYLIENPEKQDIFLNYENISFEIDYENNEIVMYQTTDEEKVKLDSEPFKNDFSFEVKEDVDGTIQTVKKSSNVYIVNLINGLNEKILNEKILKEDAVEGSEEKIKFTVEDAVKKSSFSLIKEKYLETKESFLWIDNIWISDSPFNQSIVDYNGYVSQVGKNNVEENEEIIYNSFMLQLKSSQSKTNGYFILPILCILASVLTMLLTSKVGNKNNQTKQNKLLLIILPIIFGIFALLYNSVFAIYMLISQIMAAITLPLQNLILNSIDKRKSKKVEEKVEIDYTRKF